MTNESRDSLEERLKELNDAFTVRALALLDVMDELYEKNNEQINRNAQAIDRLGLQIDRNALAIDRLTSRFDASIAQAEADRAVMLQLLRVMAGQQPNGKGES